MKKVSPEQLAELFGIDEGLALAYMAKLAQLGFLKSFYEMYCPKHVESLLNFGYYRNAGELPLRVKCEQCKKDYSDREYLVSLYFIKK